MYFHLRCTSWRQISSPVRSSTSMTSTEINAQLAYITKLNTGPGGYAERHQYWDNRLPGDSTTMRALLLREAHQPAQEFWTLFNEQFTPAARNQEMDTAAKVLAGPMADAYQRHRSAIDKVVTQATSDLSAAQTDARDSVSSSKQRLLLIALAAIALAVAFGGTIIVNILKLQRQRAEAEAGNTIKADQLGQVVNGLTSNAGTLAGRSHELTDISRTMSDDASDTANQAQQLALASGQVTDALQTVATGIEEMQASISEIAKGAAGAARTATSAVSVANDTRKVISKLGESSSQIGHVIDVISSIAENTNMLALNATIEAARAGEAGKGFAVVANEVKDLANATAKATDEIKHRIKQIQGDTSSAVNAIEKIGTVINEINATQEGIASAVEEQSATTAELARGVSEVTFNTSAISASITEVASSAQATATCATQTQAAATELAHLAKDLDLIASEASV